MNIFIYLIFFFTILTLFATIVVFIGLIMFGITKVPYVPAPQKAVEKMFLLAKIKPNEKVYDLGCGNGNLVFKAEKKYQANAIGFEISPWPYSLAILRRFFNHYKSKIYFKNFFKQNLSDANVIFCYLMPSVNNKLVHKLNKELTPKTRIISYSFNLPGLKDFKLVAKWYNGNTPIYKYQITN